MESAHGSWPNNMIDLGYKETPCYKPEEAEEKEEGGEKVYYPTLYIRSKEKIELPEGTFKFMGVGKKVAYSERNGEYTCEIEIESIEPKGGKAKSKKAEMDSMTEESDDIVKGFEAEISKVVSTKYPGNAEDVETS